ncbi:MAG: holo-[acyl-carrier-protein] synthase [Chloroflexi bacterium]|nr:holo-[acyl-carrier-protein] synthase [Chloroflexota bacterium]
MLRCGIDMIENHRIEAGIARFGDRFLNRFFTPAELADCGDTVQRLAARFAAKEAVAKALGTGIGVVRWRDIEIRRDALGRPVLHLHGPAAQVAAMQGLTQWDVSLTHTHTYASAICVAM